MTNDTYPSVGCWDRQSKDGRSHGVGSVVLVAPHWALTATHVIKGVIEDPRLQILIRFAGGTGSQIAHIVPHLRHPRRDIALVRLASAVSEVEPARLSLTRLSEQHGEFEISVVGRPIRYRGEPTFADGRTAVADGSRILHLKRSGYPGRKGDSGGAYIVGGAVVGVISRGKRHPEYGEVSLAVQPAAVKNWIDDVLGNDGCRAVWVETP